jgi:hydrogenase expression/formation protein HypE
MAHGSGGRLTHELIGKVFRAAFRNGILDRGDDAAVFSAAGAGRLAFTTDTYVVRPLFFPGADIGRLAVCGTVNDLCMVGATPRYLSVGFVLEEGLPLDVLRRVVASMAAAAVEAGVEIVTGDTKVVDRGLADGMYINTSGVGFVAEGVQVGGALARPGDAVLISGTVGDHGIAVVSQREGLSFGTSVQSDAAPLTRMAGELTRAGAAPGGQSPLHVMRDPTRGGLATTLNEIARQSGVRIEVEEATVPVRPEVRAACEMLGYDPLYVANEGKMVAIVDSAWAGEALAAMRASPYGEDARVIGRVGAAGPGRVLLKTLIGGTRILDMLSGELLPRIC